MTSPDLVTEAQALIECLTGVVRVRVTAGARGIDAIHVTAASDDVARTLAGHVRSALLAGLATPVLPARIHVRVDPDASLDDHRPGDDHDRRDTAAPADAATPRHRIRLLEDHIERERAEVAGREGAEDVETGRAPEPTAGTRAGQPRPGETRRDRAEAGEEEGEEGEAERPVTERPRLVAVDVERPGDGRVLCRVAVAYDAHVHRAEAVAIDLPGAAAQAAAQAAVRALVDAGLAGLELGGLREVEIAGHDYVVVALRRTGPHPRRRSGSAPIIGSPERSAAEAAVAAALQMA